MFCYKYLNRVSLWGNIRAEWMIIFCLTPWFYTWVCALGAIRTDETMYLKIVFSGQKHSKHPRYITLTPCAFVYVLEESINLCC